MGGGAASAGKGVTGGGGATCQQVIHSVIVRFPTICMGDRTVDKLTGIIFVILCLSAACASIAAAVSAAQSAKKTRSAQRLGNEIDEVKAAFESCRMLLKRINSRDAMREFRERETEEPPKKKRGAVSAVPDWRTDPDGFRAYHEQRMANQKGTQQ